MEKLCAESVTSIKTNYARYETLMVTFGTRPNVTDRRLVDATANSGHNLLSTSHLLYIFFACFI